MTPLPKKKHSKSASKTRRAAFSLRLPQLTICTNCQSPKFPHRACPNCGFYKKPKEAKNLVADKAPVKAS